MYIGRMTFKNKQLFLFWWYVVVRLLKHGVRIGPTDPKRIPTTEGLVDEGQPRGRREDTTTQLKLPAPLDFEAIKLEEMEARSRVIHGLAMCGRGESMKVKLFFVFSQESGMRNLQYDDIRSTRT